jgi:hypothetical protein
MSSSDTYKVDIFLVLFSFLFSSFYDLDLECDECFFFLESSCFVAFSCFAPYFYKYLTFSFTSMFLPLLIFFLSANNLCLFLFSYFYFLLEPLDDELFRDDSELEPLPLFEEDEPLPDEELPEPLPDDELPLNEPDEDEPLTC